MYLEGMGKGRKNALRFLLCLCLLLCLAVAVQKNDTVVNRQSQLKDRRNGVGDVGNVVLRDRQHLAEDGILIVVMSLDKYTGQLAAGPDIVSRGFVYVKESDELMEEAQGVVDAAINGLIDRGISDWGKLKTTTKDVLGDYVWKKTKRRPMILPIILEV